MARYKILRSKSDAEDKGGVFSYVEIGTDIGKFFATAELHPEDNFSNFLGCEIAESKAVRKYMKKKISYLKERLNEIENFEKMLLCCKAYNPKGFEARRLRRRKYELRDEIKVWERRYNSLSDRVINSFRAREETVKKIQAKKAQNSEN